MIAAAVTTRALPRNPETIESGCSAVVDVAFADAGDEEDLVVHREAEQQCDHDHGQEADDR